MLLIASALACPWPEEALFAGAAAALASPLRWDIVDEIERRRLTPRALAESLEHGRPWRLERTLLDTHPHDLVVAWFHMEEDVRSNIGIWSTGSATVFAWREHRVFGEREVYTQDRIVAWGLVDNHAVAYGSVTFPGRTVYKGLTVECR